MNDSVLRGTWEIWEMVQARKPGIERGDSYRGSHGVPLGGISVPNQARALNSASRYPRPCVPVLVSRRQQFVVPAITGQRRIVQSRKDGQTVAVARIHERVVSVAGT